MFYPVAIRICSENCTGAKKLQRNKFYYFINKVSIDSESGQAYIDPYRIEDELFNQNRENTPCISISAIVGENGAGKSTIVEMLIRLINNFSAVIIGEYSDTKMGKHLHFINGINAELYFLKGNSDEKTLFRLKIENRHVTLTSYDCDDYDKGIFVLSEPPIYDNAQQAQEDPEGLIPFKAYRNNEGLITKKELLETFFYTYLSNFSIYAYNHSDFADEFLSTQYEAKCCNMLPNMIKSHERSWLSGVFHRRESYQVPLVLYPARIDGVININKENWLAHNRFISVIVSPKSRFRKINDHLSIIGLNLSVNGVCYDLKYLKKHAEYNLTQAGFNVLRTKIILEWGQITDCDLVDISNQRKYGAAALDYIVYKTLKITSKHSRYRKYFYKNHSRVRTKINLMEVHHLVEALAKDESHVTRKIRQTLIYLKYGLFDNTDDLGYISIETVTSDAERILEMLKENEDDRFKLRLRCDTIEELTPPPFISSSVIVKDLYTNIPVRFNSLSSGERQFIYSITGILYQLVNIDSVALTFSDDLAYYKDINIILEEIELYFHPDLQRRLVKTLLDSVNQCLFRSVKNIHILLITHSPFVLSDIPARNILALQKDGTSLNSSEIKSFGANIHDILKHPFFLKDGAVGEHAKYVLNDIARWLSVLRHYSTRIKNNDDNAVNNLRRLQSLISLVDEPILRKVLMDEFNNYVPINNMMERKRIEEEIQRLTDKLNELYK